VAVLQEGSHDAWLVITEFGLTLGCLIWMLALVVLFVRKQRGFPRAMIGLSLVWLLLDAVGVVRSALGRGSDRQALAGFAVSALVAGSLVSYLSRSRGVKATFDR
jgi:hypothetical protein